MEAKCYINDHLGTTELVTDRNGMIKTQIEHSPFGDMVTGGTSVRIEKAINSAGFDPNNTSAIVANGQARPVKSVTEYEQLLYRFNDLTGTSDPHFSTAKEYVYNHNNPDILQLKVVSSLTYAGSNGPVEKIEYLDLTDKPLGQYKIALDFRKDVGGNISTLNDKFEIYISRVNIYSQSQVQTMPIAVEPGTTSFTFAPQGIGLTNVTWLYSQDNGNSWDNIVPGTNTALPNGTGNILIKAIFSPGFYPESPVLNGFKVTFVSTGNGDSEDYFFTGKEKDVTGLYYFGARYYDPEIGRFITEDPGQDGEDWFGYCRNNPMNLIDPDGRFVQIPYIIYVYLTALATSPDLQYDIQLLSLDLAEGQYYAAAADIIGIALPGVPASVTNAPVKWLTKWLAEHGDELMRILSDSKLFGTTIDAVTKPFQVHHWINQAIKNHSLLQKAKTLGVDIATESWNLSRIPHQGGHTNEYYRYVRTLLDNAYSVYLKEGRNWDYIRMQRELQEIIGKIMTVVASGKVGLYR